MNSRSAHKRRVNRVQPLAQAGRMRLGQALILLAVLIVIGVASRYSLTYRDTAGSTAAAPRAIDGTLSEVDFGFVELNPGLAVPITSYKHGGPMVLYPGEELRYQVLGDTAATIIELRVGGAATPLLDTDGKVPVAGLGKQPLPVTMVLQTTRLSLPGGAPARVSVKVQVFGATRPT